MSNPTRLDKRLVELLQCSRTDAQHYIEGGWVTVNGDVIDMPQHPVSDETVALMEGATLTPPEPATLLLNKPAGVDMAAALAMITPASRAESYVVGQRTLQRHFHRQEAVMPVDASYSGLVIFSQDWRIHRHVEQFHSSLEQEFVVDVTGELAPYGMAKLSRGMIYQGRSLSPCKVSWQSENRLRFAIKDVRVGQLRWMCAQVGLKVSAIRRLRVGQVGLSKMPEGNWRYLGAGQRI
jgi:23S rRNA pseudouridine2604 synthase